LKELEKEANYSHESNASFYYPNGDNPDIEELVEESKRL
jgi:hypothetical protein